VALKHSPRIKSQNDLNVRQRLSELRIEFWMNLVHRNLNKKYFFNFSKLQYLRNLKASWPSNYHQFIIIINTVVIALAYEPNASNK